MRTLLLTGASGLLGVNLARLTVERYRVVAVSHTHPTAPPGCQSYRCDLTDAVRTVRCLHETRPEVIVHAAALTDVERCEREPDLAERLNVEATSTLVEWAARHRAAFVYLSTDSVFDGQRGSYREEDQPAPLNVYARTKVRAEAIVRARLPEALIVRTNFYGWRGRKTLTFGEKILAGLVNGERLTMFTDVWFSPLVVNDLASILLALLAQGARGTYHVAARDACSKYQFTLWMAQALGLSPAKVVSVSVDTYPFVAQRPKNTSLLIDKVSGVLGRPMPSVQEGLQTFKALLMSGYVPSLTGEAPTWLTTLQYA